MLCALHRHHLFIRVPFQLPFWSIHHCSQFGARNYPANTRCWTSVVLMLGQWRFRDATSLGISVRQIRHVPEWPRIPCFTLLRIKVTHNNQPVWPMLTQNLIQHRRHWASCAPAMDNGSRQSSTRMIESLGKRIRLANHWGNRMS